MPMNADNILGFSGNTVSLDSFGNNQPNNWVNEVSVFWKMKRRAVWIWELLGNLPISLIKTFEMRHYRSRQAPQALLGQSIQVSATSCLVTASMATVHWPALEGNRISGKTETFNNSTCQYRSERKRWICTKSLNKLSNEMSDLQQVTRLSAPHFPRKPNIASLVSKKIHTTSPCPSNPLLSLDFLFPCFPYFPFPRKVTVYWDTHRKW